MNQHTPSSTLYQLRMSFLYILLNCTIWVLCLRAKSRPFHKLSPQIVIHSLFIVVCTRSSLVMILLDHKISWKPQISYIRAKLARSISLRQNLAIPMSRYSDVSLVRQWLGFGLGIVLVNGECRNNAPNSATLPFFTGKTRYIKSLNVILHSVLFTGFVVS